MAQTVRANDEAATATKPRWADVVDSDDESQNSQPLPSALLYQKSYDRFEDSQNLPDLLGFTGLSEVNDDQPASSSCGTGIDSGMPCSCSWTAAPNVNNSSSGVEQPPTPAGPPAAWEGDFPMVMPSTTFWVAVPVVAVTGQPFMAAPLPPAVGSGMAELDVADPVEPLTPFSAPSPMASQTAKRHRMVSKRRPSPLRVVAASSKRPRAPSVIELTEEEAPQASSSSNALPEASEEEWQHRIKKRHLAVSLVRASPEYQAAKAANALEEAPRTPDPQDRTVSKRRWEEEVRTWKVCLRARTGAD